MAEHMMNQPKAESNPESKRIHPIALGLYAFCQANRDHYRDLDMQIEARVFDTYMRSTPVDIDDQLADPEATDSGNESTTGAKTANAIADAHQR